MVRNLLIGLLIWLACLAEMGWTVWTKFQIAPAFLDLSIVASVLFATPRWTVFWSGFIGVLSCINHQLHPGATILLYSSIGFVAAISKPFEHKRASITTTAFRSLIVLCFLRIGNLWLANMNSSNFLVLLEIEHVAQIAFSFLLSVLLCTIFVFLRRKSAWA